KRIAAIALGSLVFVGLVQAQTIEPTTNGAGPDASDTSLDKSSNIASVMQDVNLMLPEVVALHLDVTALDFDMSLIGSDAPYTCVYGVHEAGGFPKDGSVDYQVPGRPVMTTPLG